MLTPYDTARELVVVGVGVDSPCGKRSRALNVDSRWKKRSGEWDMDLPGGRIR